MANSKKLSDRQVVGTSFVVSVSDVALNFIVALFTGSVVLLSQVLQGLSDLLTASVLYIGVERSKRGADAAHQFGYGREVFFWVLIAAILMFLGTGGLTMFFGLQRLVHPEPIENIGLAIAMLAFGSATNAYSFSRSLRRLNQLEGTESWWRRVVYAGMVETKATLLIDFLGTAAAVLGFVALVALLITGDTRLDGIGAIVIGASMMAGALLLMRDIHGLIIGRAVSPVTSDKIKRAVLTITGVQEILDLRTMYIGSSKLLVILEIHFDDRLNTTQIESLSDEIKRAVRRKVPHAFRIQVEVETPDNELIP